MDHTEPTGSITNLMPTHGVLMITKLTILFIDEDDRLKDLSLMTIKIQRSTKLQQLSMFLPSKDEHKACETRFCAKHAVKAVAQKRKRVKFEKQLVVEMDKKVLMEMVRNLKSLKRLWLHGFEDEELRGS